jgi:MFS family permease
MSNPSSPFAIVTGHFWVLALSSVGFFMAAINAFAMVTALPSIQRDLGASLETLEWTVSAYSLTAAGFIITAASLGDRLGRARVFTTGLALFTIASAICAVAPGPAVLITGRALQGLGAAIIVPLGLTILTSAFPPERRGAVVGFWAGVAGLAGRNAPFNRPAARESRASSTYRRAGSDAHFLWSSQHHVRNCAYDRNGR